MKPDDTATSASAKESRDAIVPQQSRYEDYNDTFHRYDDWRIPIGSADIIAALSRMSVPLAQQTVLDGGCGTGTYTRELAPHVGNVIGIEASATGLQQARAKLTDHNNVRIERGNILALRDSGIEDASVHGYMVNQVLHHIDEPGGSFPNVSRFRDEVARVLKPGGMLTINTCTQAQLEPEAGVFWNYRYIPERAALLRRRYIPVPALIARMQDTGAFKHVDSISLQGNIFSDGYWEPEAMLTESFQAGDSVYAGIRAEEVEQMVERFKRDSASGALSEHLAAARRRVAEMGWSVLVVFERVSRSM